MRLLHRNRWPVVIALYDARQCPYCAALVTGNHGQRAHEQWHEDLDTEVNGEETAPDPGGYVIGNGPLPASVRGGEDSDLPARWALYMVRSAAPGTPANGRGHAILR